MHSSGDLIWNKNMTFKVVQCNLRRLSAPVCIMTFWTRFWFCRNDSRNRVQVKYFFNVTYFTKYIDNQIQTPKSVRWDHHNCIKASLNSIGTHIHSKLNGVDIPPFFWTLKNFKIQWSLNCLIKNIYIHFFLLFYYHIIITYYSTIIYRTCWW